VSSERYDIVVVKYGSRTSRRRDVFLNHGLSGAPDGEIGMDYFFWVIRGADRTILVDTGFSSAVGTRRGRTPLADPFELFARTGVSPASSPSIVVTHAHYDHIGNLAEFDRSPIYLARAELDFWASPMRGRGEFAALTEATEIDALLAADRDGRVTAVDGEYDLAPGIRLIPVGGHTPGQLMVEVATHAGTVLLTSDVVHYDEELDTDVPFTHLSDLPELLRAFDRVRAARDAGAIVVSGHDPGVLARFGSPLPGLEDLTATIGSAPAAPPERRTTP
jgi:glyoxylase-like metal-dependent hydrolase (beta-lactamase superfamily II)